MLRKRPKHRMGSALYSWLAEAPEHGRRLAGDPGRASMLHALMMDERNGNRIDQGCWHYSADASGHLNRMISTYRQRAITSFARERDDHDS